MPQERRGLDLSRLVRAVEAAQAVLPAMAASRETGAQDGAGDGGAADEAPDGGAYDMKPGLLAGPAHRLTKTGQPYTIVPLRQGTPGAKRLTPMPWSVYRVARRTAPGGVVELPDDLAAIGQGVQNRMGYSRQTGTYAGMVRQPAGRGSRYTVFRTVSMRSDPMSWWRSAQVAPAAPEAAPPPRSGASLVTRIGQIMAGRP